mgnify:CR=1 FL=1
MGSFKLVMDERRPHDRIHFDLRLIDKSFEVLERVDAVAMVQPEGPIQFCEERSSPGFFSVPRTPSSRTA